MSRSDTGHTEIDADEFAAAQRDPKVKKLLRDAQAYGERHPVQAPPVYPTLWVCPECFFLRGHPGRCPHDHYDDEPQPALVKYALAAERDALRRRIAELEAQRG